MATPTQLLAEYYRCRPDIAELAIAGELSETPRFFQLGSNVTCYGRLQQKLDVSEQSYDCLGDVRISGSTVALPFNPAEVMENLRRERYVTSSTGTSAGAKGIVRKLYYAVRPLLSISVRKHLQRLSLRDWQSIRFPRWPVDTTVEDLHKKLLALSMKAAGVHEVPFIWFWPEGAECCAMFTHDIETAAGRDFCGTLMDMHDEVGIKSSFQVIPETRYQVTQPFLETIRQRGFEINIHDLNHDGHLFSSRELFLRRAEQINRYAKLFGAKGFRSAVLYRNLEWFDALQFSYDMSVPNVAHLDPQRGGCCTVMPYFVGEILELPLTAMQDYTLFEILDDFTLDSWKQQIGMIRAANGLVSFNIHPDYLIQQRARRVYAELLRYVQSLGKHEHIWIALPGAVNRWWRQRCAMRLVQQGSEWVIEGEGSEHACLAYASLNGEGIVYSVEQVGRRREQTINASGRSNAVSS